MQLPAFRDECRLLIEQLREAARERAARAPQLGIQPRLPLDVDDEEVYELLAALLREVARTTPILSFAAAADARDRIDLAPFWQFVDQLRDLGAASWDSKSAEHLQELDDQKQVMDAAQTQFGPVETGFRVWWPLNAIISDLLRVAVKHDVDLSDPVATLRAKLKTLSDEQVQEIWSRVQQEASPLHQVNPAWQLTLGSDLFPANFFGLASPDVLRNRIAEYIVRLKPAAILRAMARSTEVLIPAGVPGIPALLTLQQHVEDPDPEDVRLLNAVMRVLSACPPDRRAELVQSMGTTKESWLQRSPEFAATGRSREWAAEYVLREAERLCVLVESRARGASQIEMALLQYKLGLEVTREESIKQVERQPETTLQRRVCRYLIERGIRAQGTYFDNAEIDILAEVPEAGESLVIEVKLYKKGASISEKQLQRQLAQLQAYVDKNYAGARGTLFVFNLTNTPIKAPRTWLRKQYRIVAINLPEVPPSKLRSHVEISEGIDGTLIHVMRNGADGQRKKSKQSR